MKLIFQLRFHTEPGQSLWLTGDHEMFGSGRAEQAIPLQYLNPELWQATIHLPAGTAPDARISYHYLLRNADGSVVEDWDNKRITPASFRQDEVLMVDAWNRADFFENTFYTEPFRQVLLKANHTEVRVSASERPTHTFKVKAPLLAREPDPLPAGRVRRAGPLEHGEPPAPEPDCRRGFSHRGTGPPRTTLPARLQIWRL